MKLREILRRVFRVKREREFGDAFRALVERPLTEGEILRMFPPPGFDAAATEGEADTRKPAVYRTSSGRYRWRIFGPDGSVHRRSPKSYARKQDAIRGLKRATA